MGIQIFVRGLQRTHALNVEPGDTIESVQAQLEHKEKVSDRAALCRLVASAALVPDSGLSPAFGFFNHYLRTDFAMIFVFAPASLR